MLADLCRNHTLDVYAPATVLANRSYECLYSVGATDRYLRTQPGTATGDLLAMVSVDLRTKLRSAMLRAVRTRKPVTVGGGQAVRDGRTIPYSIDVHPILHGNEALLAIHFVDAPASQDDNAARSRLLAAASHDLRQPLQSLTLLQGMLADHVDGAVSELLITRLAETVGAVSGMLNTLLDMSSSGAPPDKGVSPAFTKQTIHDLVPARAVTEAADPGSNRVRNTDPRVVFLVDDDTSVRIGVRLLLERDGRTVQDFASGEAFFAAYIPGAAGCLLVDAYLPGIGGLELLQRLRAAGDPLPAIVITGNSDVSMAVKAMKAGAADFIEKPIAAADLLLSIDHALERSRDSSKQMAWYANAVEHVAGLTARQHEIMNLVLAGHPSKNIAADLGISQRTVENHRASIMRKTGTKSLPALARLALAATSTAADDPVMGPIDAVLSID